MQRSWSGGRRSHSPAGKLWKMVWTGFWIDTCCIDKSSSAELSEAINSMFNYYQSSEVCYVYLGDFADVGVSDDMEGATAWLAATHTPRWFKRPPCAILRKFSKCSWWRRGWTLQELLAPEYVQFYNSGWKHVGRLFNMVSIVSTITGIDTGVLLHAKKISVESIATRMSWTSNRRTRRLEDEAYVCWGSSI